jgi:polyketide synthase Type III
MSQRFVSVLPSPRPRIVSVGTAQPCQHYSQDALADLLEVPDGLGRRLFKNAGIEGRFLYLEPTADGNIPDEDEGDLLARHRRGCIEVGRAAIERCLAPVALEPSDVDFLCCVTSTGFMLPGVSAMYVKHLGFRADCQRIDIVGMGCNAALNGFNAAACWASANAGRNALVVCCEINSAIHVRDQRTVTSLVNSLFGDGGGAVLFNCETPVARTPEILGFSSHIIPDAWRAISYHWSRDHNKFELFLDKAIPAVLGEHSPHPIQALLDEFGICRCDISHWLVHAGGVKVITAIRDANGLEPHDLRHATDVLRRTGNLGSATVIFSYEDLLREEVVDPGDYGLLVTMGPGATVETALVRW